MKKHLLILLLLLLLTACGGGGGEEPKKIHYLINLHKETKLTTNRWDQGSSSSAKGKGVYFVAFMDNRENYNAISGEDIWGIIVDENMKVKKEFPIFRRPGRDINPKVLYDDINQRFVVVWQSYATLGSSNIMMAIVSPTGDVSEVKSLELNGYLENPEIASSSEGFVLAFRHVWSTYDANIGSKVLRVAHLSRNLEVIEISTITDDAVHGVKVVPLGFNLDCAEHICFITYNMIKEPLREGSNLIYGVFFNLKTHSIMGKEIQISDNAIAKASSKTSPLVKYGNGKFFVTWKDWDSPYGVDVMGRYVNMDATLGSNILVSDLKGLSGMVYSYVLSYNPKNKSFYVVFEDSRSGKPLDTDLFLRRVGVDEYCVLISNQVLNQGLNSIVITENDSTVFYTRSETDELGYRSFDVYGFQLNSNL